MIVAADKGACDEWWCCAAVHGDRSLWGETSPGQLRAAPRELASRAACWDNGHPLGLDTEGDNGEIYYNEVMIPWDWQGGA